MKIFNESDLLNREFRLAVIKDIESNENKSRKAEAYKKHRVYKDKTKKYVLEQLESEYEKDTLQEIKNLCSNISIGRKMIDKRAMVYKNGATRKASDEIFKSQIDMIVDEFDVNRVMKKVNSFVELFYNCAVQTMPMFNEASGKYNLKLNVLPPYLYDVIEDAQNPEEAKCVIYSYYNNGQTQYDLAPEQARRTGTVNLSFAEGDGQDQLIADSPADQGKPNKLYVFWSDKYHFTCDEKGEIVRGLQDDKLLNPIGKLPYTFFAQDQDGAFWSEGGDDIIDGSILINRLLTELFFIAKLQGMGIFYMFAKNPPKTFKFGPNRAIVIDQQEGDPTPSIGFATSNPPLNDHMAMIEQYLAFLLSTNDLSPSSVSAKLTATSAPSGVSQLIERSELTGSIEDQEEIFKDKEPLVINVISKWLNLYFDKGLLSNNLMQIGPIDETERYSLQFASAQPFMTEPEKLNILKQRIDIGIDSIADAIMKDNPDLTREEALEIHRRNLEEKLIQSARELNADQQKESDKEIESISKDERARDRAEES